MTLADEFDHPHDVEHKSRTRNVPDQSTGAWNAPDDSAWSTIQANIQERPVVRERDHAMEGSFEDGEIRLFTDADVSIGDLIRVHHDDTGSNHTVYQVDEVEGHYEFLGQHNASLGRAEYRCHRRDD